MGQNNFGDSKGSNKFGSPQGRNAEPNNFRGPQEPNDGNRGPNNFGGMSDEDREKMDEQRSKQEEERMKKQEEADKKRQERDMKMMKNGFKQGLKGMKQMKTKLASAEKNIFGKCGISTPADLKEALAKVDEIAGKIDATTDFEELQTLMMDFQDSMNSFRESEGTMGFMMEFCQRMMPEAKRQLKQFDSNYKRLEKLVKKSKEVDLTGALSEYKTQLESLRSTLEEVKTTLATSPEDAMEKLKGDFFESMDTMYTKQGEIEAVANMSKGLSSLVKEQKRLKAQLAKLMKKKDVDTSSLEEAVGSLGSAIGEIQSLQKQKVDPEELMGAFESAFEAMQNASNALEELGVQMYGGGMNFNASPKAYSLSVPKVNFNQFNLPEQRPGQNQMGPGFGGQGAPTQGPGFNGDQGFGGPGGPMQGPMGPEGGFGPQDGFGPEAKATPKTQVARR